MMQGFRPVFVAPRLFAAQSTLLSSSSSRALPHKPLDEFVERWCRHQPTAVTLKSLCEIGLDREKRRQHGVFLHRDLRIRIAQRILELHSLPYGLADRVGICDVIRWYTDFLQRLEDSPVPDTNAKDEAFTTLLTQIFEEHQQVIQAMAMGVHDLMAELKDEYELVRPQVDATLQRFFTARIGLRFLLQHHIESLENREGHSGILQLECNPFEVARRAAKDSEMLCRYHLGQAPPVIVETSEPRRTFTYVPMHLSYMLTEVMKNACRATTEHHGEGYDDELPPVRVQIVHGNEDVTFKISDEGGGISRSRMSDVWKFMYTTFRSRSGRSPWQSVVASHPSTADSLDNPLQRQKQGSVLAGFGVGLSLSRLYAQYFGGDLKIMSLDGYGTDVYLHLNRLGTHCENLPKVVLYSPSMRDSSLLHDPGDSQEQLLISADEEAFLQRELAAYRRNAKEEPSSQPR